MRLLVAAVVLLGLSFGAAPASAAPRLWGQALRLDHVVVDVAADLAASVVYDVGADVGVDVGADVGADVVDAVRRAPPSLPSAYSWVERDTRAFWYSAGANAVTTLGAHVLVGLPTLALTTTGLIGLQASPAITFALAAGVAGGYFLGVSALAAVASFAVFNGMSEYYQGSYLPAFAADFTASLASTAVTTLTFGGGALLFHGLGQLATFTGSAGISTLSIFTLLGAMPAVVVAGIALIAVPALVTSWAVAVSARPREGYAIDDGWLTSSSTPSPSATQATLTAVSRPSRPDAPAYALAVEFPLGDGAR